MPYHLCSRVPPARCDLGDGIEELAQAVAFGLVLEAHGPEIGGEQGRTALEADRQGHTGPAPGQGAVGQPTHSAESSPAGPAAACRQQSRRQRLEEQQHHPLDRDMAASETTSRAATTPKTAMCPGFRLMNTRNRGSDHHRKRSRRSRSIGSGWSTPASKQDCARRLANSEGYAHGSRRMLIQRWAPRRSAHQASPRFRLHHVRPIDRQQ